MRERIEDFGGRRYVMTMGCCFIATGLVWFGKVSGGEFVTLISLAMAFYNGANTLQKVSEGKNESINPRTQD